MANYDQYAEAVNALSGGKNVVLLDDNGLPSIYCAINKLKNSEIISGGSENTHLAFSVNDVEKSRFFVSKYQNVVINGRAYSLPHRDPKVEINFDEARSACEAKGTGFHLTTMAEWAAVALWCRKNGTMPHGNNNFGRDISATHEKGQEASKDSGKTGRTFTGSGPATWGHDWTQFGIQDMNGNVWEWLGGLRMVDGQFQIIPYNNAALGSECDMSSSSTLWKAIKSDGSLIDPATKDGTLHYDWISSKITLTDAIDTFATDAGQGTEYKSLALKDGLTVPEIAKALILYPDEPGGDYGGDYRYIDCVGERLPLAGGYWSNGALAGVFHVDLGHPRSLRGWNIGFRSAFVEL